MEEEIDKILNSLLRLDKKGIANTNYSDGVFSFKYGGGKFILIKSVSANLSSGYLNLFHETPFSGEKQLIEVNGFEIKVIKDVWGYTYRIKNYMEFTQDDYSRFVDDEGYMKIGLDDLLYIFPNQLIAKLVSDNFRIYLK